MKKSNIILKPITKSDYQFLYDLMMERTQNINIEHNTMPTYIEHVKFIKTKPYYRWLMIICDNYKVGTIYLTKKNEIGVFIKKDCSGKGVGQKATKLLMDRYPKSYYFTNINPKNRNSISFFKKIGFKPLKIVFRYGSIVNEKNKTL